MGSELMAGMGEYVVSHNDDTLMALGLGSCIGVAIVDEEAGIGGLAHVMLPDSAECQRENETNPNKFADKAIPNMIEEMVKKGAKKERMKAKIAGGGHMFTSIMDENQMNIGKRNGEAVIKVLETQGIPLTAKDIGGSLGRTVRFDLAKKKLIIKTKEGIKEI